MKIKTNTLGKNKTSPEIIDSVIKNIERDILHGIYEGEKPIEKDITFSNYKGGGYTINCDAEIKSLDGKTMKYIFRESKTPYVVIKRCIKTNSSGKLESRYREVSIIRLMEKFFGKHILGYKNTLKSPDLYRVVPKDNNWRNLAWDNLVYVNKNDYNKIGTKGLLIEYNLLYGNEYTSIKVLSDNTGVDASWIYKIRKKLIDEGKIWKDVPQELKSMRIYGDMLDIYMGLYFSRGKKSNKEIIQEVSTENRDEKDSKWRKKMTNRVVRARRVLLDINLIQKFDTYGKEVSIDSVREELTMLLLNREKNGYTHKEIAKILGLDKNQVDNYSRKFSKKDSKI